MRRLLAVGLISTSVAVIPPGNRDSNTSALIGHSSSADGRYLVFTSNASDLVENESHGFTSVYLVSDYLSRVPTLEDLDGNADSATITIEGEDVLEAGPTVTEVIVDSEDWSVPFRDLADGELGDERERGYVIPRGEDQIKSLPWTNVDRTHVVFSEDVSEPGRTDLQSPGSQRLE